MKLVLINSLSKEKYELIVRDNGSTMNYYKLEINLYDNMAEGEYEYTLLDDNNNEISNGLLQIGDYKQNNDVYEHKNKIVVYEQ
jgi:hypothetical protein